MDNTIGCLALTLKTPQKSIWSESFKQFIFLSIYFPLFLKLTRRILLYRGSFLFLFKFYFPSVKTLFFEVSTDVFEEIIVFEGSLLILRKSFKTPVGWLYCIKFSPRQGKKIYKKSGLEN